MSEGMVPEMGVLHFIYGNSINSGWGIAAAIYVSAVFVAFAIGGYRSVHELGKAVDVRFDEEKFNQYNLHRPAGTAPRTIDWCKARKQQVRSLRFTIPFGVIVFAALYYWMRYSYSLKTYFTLVAVWLVFLMVLRVWWIATVVWTDRKLVKKGVYSADKRPLSRVSVAWAVKHYLNWGLQKSTVKRPPYIGLLRPLNPFIKLFGLRWLQYRLVLPLIYCVLIAFF